MKKISTLIAVAAMAMSVNAQEQYTITKGWFPTQKETTTISDATASTSIVYSNDPGWKASNPSNGGYAQSKGYTGGVVGTQNPKDGGYNDSWTSQGSGYSVSNANLPNAGTYYTVRATQAGTFVLAGKVGAGKNFYICTGDGTALATNTITATGVDDVTLTLSSEYKWLNGSDNYEGELLITFTAEANKDYSFFCTGSKLTFFGYTFTPAGGNDGITTTKAVNEANATLYNLAGQKVGKDYKGVVIQNGRKFVNK